MDQRPTETVWGSVGEMAGGLGAAGAVALAVTELRATRLQRIADDERRRAEELERRVAAARSVGISSGLEPVKGRPGRWIFTCKVANLSGFPIENAVVLLPDWELEGCDPKMQRGTAEWVLGTVLTGNDEAPRIREDDWVFSSGWEPTFGETTGPAYVAFTDVWGKNWIRGSGSLEELPEPMRIC